jgi:hypothetical protein
VLKETDRETKHIIETLVAFENGIDPIACGIL